MRTVVCALVALCFAAPAAAATPRLGFFDLHDLAKGSRNVYGDLKLTARPPAAPFVVRCAAGCRFGKGWLGFTQWVGPTAGQVRSASARIGPVGWSLRLALTARGQSAWLAYQRIANRRLRKVGVPDVLAVALDGRVLAAPLAAQVRLRKGVLDVPGFTPRDARAAARSFVG